MTDTCDTYTMARPEMQALYKKHADVMLDQMREAFDAILALEGDPAELVNDALSIMSELAASASLLFMAKMMESKPGIDSTVVWTMCVVDMQNRMRRGIAQFHEYADATRQ